MELRHETPESRAYQRDLQNLQKHQDKAWDMFQRLLARTERLAESARQAFPEEPKLQQRAFVKSLQQFSPATRYLNTYVGTEKQSPKAKSWRRRTLYQLRNLHFIPDYSLAEAERVVRQVAAQGFQAIELHKGQKPLEVLPGEILALLPKNIVVQVDEDGRITKMTTRFSNAHENLSKKISKMRELAERYNEIVAKVKKDLRNPDELTRLSALITAIVMETGIRPGKIGQGFTKLVDGEELSIDTFGAITLGPPHVKFIRDNFAELSFPGKKGTINIASLSDPQVIKLLKTYVDRALHSEVPFLFVTEDGEQYGYKHFQRYFRTKVLSGIAPSDFRKLKATQAVLDHLNAEQEALYQKVKEFSETEIENLKERVTEEIVKVIQAAYEKATATLSHEEAKTAIEQYINPEVILRFLSQGKIEDDLKRAILEHETYLSFDPEVFIQKALSKKAFVSLEVFQKRLASLNEALEFLREQAYAGGDWKANPKPFVELILRNRGHRPLMDYARTHFGTGLVEFKYVGLNLRGLDLEGETVSGVNFGRSDLSEAKLDGTTFFDTRFGETNLQGASLNNVTSRGGFFYNANLQGASLVGAVLTGANLVGANLLNADARKTDLQNALMERADLEHADFRNSDLRNANLRNADLTNADLRDADLRFADLFGVNHLFMADLRGAQLPEL